MYIGHFAIGLALKARFPAVPALPIVAGVAFLDLLNGAFIFFGLDRVAPDLASGPYLFFDLLFIDWDHSLAMAVPWAALWASFFLRDRRVAAVAAMAVLSHLLADWPVHNHDLALFPYAATHIGYGLWGKLGTWAWLLEGLFALVLVCYAARACSRRGVSLLWPSVLLALLFVQLSPWFSPMKLAAALAQPEASRVHGLLVFFGFAIPVALLSWLLERAERARAPG